MTYVHFRYHDSVNALIGRHHWRYERVLLRDIPELVRSLVPKGHDQFAYRYFRAYEPWIEIAVKVQLGHPLSSESPIKVTL